MEEEWPEWPEASFQSAPSNDAIDLPRGGKRQRVEKPAHLGAYVFWSSENRRTILSRFNLQNGDLRAQSAHISAAWHSLSESERKLWTFRAQQFNLVAEIEFARVHPESGIDTRKLHTQLAKARREHGDLLIGLDIERYLNKQTARRETSTGGKQQSRAETGGESARKRASAVNSIAKLDDAYMRAASQRAAQLEAIRSQLDSTRIREFALLDLAAMLRASANALARVGKSVVTQHLPAVLADRADPSSNQILNQQALQEMQLGSNGQTVEAKQIADAQSSAALYDEAIDTLLNSTLCALSSLTCLANYAIPTQSANENNGEASNANRQLGAANTEEDDAAHNAAFEHLVEPETCCAMLESVSYLLPDVAFAL